VAQQRRELPTGPKRQVSKVKAAHRNALGAILCDRFSRILPAKAENRHLAINLVLRRLDRSVLRCAADDTLSERLNASA
jgi:hypothetical protein